MALIPTLRADCSKCAALCCVAFAFDKGEDFAIDKPPHVACDKLNNTFLCSIHANLSDEGFSGCARYDCLGAGQRVTQEVFGGQNWRDAPRLVAPMSDAFAVLRQIHRDLELLLAARALPLPAGKLTELDALIQDLAPDDGWSTDTLVEFAVSPTPKRVIAFLRGLSEHV